MKTKFLNKMVLASVAVFASGSVWAGTCTSPCIVSGTEPQVTLDPTNASAQSWEIEASTTGGEFRIGRDGLTTEPFRINRLATSNTVHIGTSGRVGINTGAPVEELDVRSTLPAIRLDDTSTGAGQVDLQMSTNTFSIEGNTGADMLVIETTAPANSLYIDSTGKIGIETANPAFNLVVGGDGDILLLNGAEDWRFNTGGAGMWLLNEGVASVKFGNNAPINSLVLEETTGHMGMGTSSPTARLHVSTTSTTETDGQILVTNSNGTNTPRKLFQLNNNGNVKFSMLPSATDEWAFNATPTEFRISKQLSGNIEMLVTDTGNMTITGTLTQGSSRDIKHDIVNVDSQEVLDKVLALPISTWSYNNDKGVTHLGPMAEDFYQAFSLGATDKGIASIDTGGVALAAIKGLNEIVKEKNAKIVALEQNNAEMSDRMARLESLVSSLVAEDKVAMIEK